MNKNHVLEAIFVESVCTLSLKAKATCHCPFSLYSSFYCLSEKTKFKRSLPQAKDERHALKISIGANHNTATCLTQKTFQLHLTILFSFLRCSPLCIHSKSNQKQKKILFLDTKPDICFFKYPVLLDSSDMFN